MTKVLIRFREKQREMLRLNPVMYSSDDMTWETPPTLLQAILQFEGRAEFDLDPCCSKPNVPAVWHYFHPESDGLQLPWHSLTFCNPPYGSALKQFMEKAYNESLRGVRIWMIVPARTETTYQHAFGLTKADFTIFMKGRVHFLINGEDKGTAPFPTMLLYFGPDGREKAERWASLQEEGNAPVAGTIMVTYKRIATNGRRKESVCDLSL